MNTMYITTISNVTMENIFKWHFSWRHTTFVSRHPCLSMEDCKKHMMAFATKIGVGKNREIIFEEQSGEMKITV